MKRIVALAAALIAVVTLTMQTAEAGGRHHRVDPRLKAVAIGTGAAATVGYFAINDWRWKWGDNVIPGQWGAIAGTTLGCAAVSTMIGTVVVKRPLTQREGHVLVGSCVVPIIGGWLVNAAYNANPQWEPQPAVAVKKKRVARKK